MESAFSFVLCICALENRLNPDPKGHSHGYLCSLPSRYLAFLLAQPQCSSDNDGRSLHAIFEAEHSKQNDSGSSAHAGFLEDEEYRVVGGPFS